MILACALTCLHITSCVTSKSQSIRLNCTIGIFSGLMPRCMFIVSMSDRYEQRTYLEIKAILVSMYRVLGCCYSNRVPFQCLSNYRELSLRRLSSSVNLMSHNRKRMMPQQHLNLERHFHSIYWRWYSMSQKSSNSVTFPATSLHSIVLQKSLKCAQSSAQTKPTVS